MKINPRKKLIDQMINLSKNGIDCSHCTGVCCTDHANSMKIDSFETEAIYKYLVEENIWDKQLEKRLDDCISTYRLDAEISTGRNSTFRKTYTCPFFGFKKLGCALPVEVKPYGCLAFNPISRGVEKGEHCQSDKELLSDIDQDENCLPLPISLKNYHIKNKILNTELIISNSTNPFFNLALEDFILRNSKSDQKKLLLWRNRPSLVLGKFQNPWLECNMDKVKELGLTLVRRQSGGGTVYHDLGNLNFSFFSENGYCHRYKNLNFIIEAFKEKNVFLEKNERNDLILIENESRYKVSGSAFKQIKNYGYHHGTLLIDANLDKLNGALKSQISGIETKSIRSVSSKVKNLNKIDPSLSYEKSIEILTTYWKQERDSEILYVDEKSFFADDLEKYTSWNWVFGETPKFTVKNGESYLECQKGIVINSSNSKYLNKKLGLTFLDCDFEFKSFFY